MRALAAAIAALILAAPLNARAEQPPPYEAPGTQPSVSSWGCYEASTDGRIHGTYLDGSLSTGPVNLPSGSPTSTSSANAPLSGGGSGSGEGILVAAVIAAVALPIVVYALDSEADGDTLMRHRCPSFRFSLSSGVMSAPVASTTWAPMVGGKIDFGMHWFGVDASLESTLDTRHYGAVDAHLQLRVPPKQHIEGAIAVGFRRVVFGGAERNGFEVALPHRYALTRFFGRPLAVEVLPAVFVGTHGLDYRLEGGIGIPIGWTSLHLGARVFSFDQFVRGGAYLGIGLGT